MDGSSPAPTLDEDDAGYLKAIASCGDQQALVLAQPIYSSTGIKLLDAGARIDGRVLDRLFGHKLSAPIDHCVTAQQAVRHKDLLARTHELVAADPKLTHFEQSLQEQSRRLWQALDQCPLPPAMQVRLMVARDSAASLFDHLLRSAFLALHIGVSARFSDNDLQVLACAALLHDIGMMHADPQMYEAGKPLGIAARRSLFAHPLTGELIARREPLLSPVIAAAIAQHHERLDGSGYPKGLQHDQIGKFGRVLMLVEVILAAFEHDHEQPWLRLSLILRLNHRSFDPQYSALVLAALPRLSVDEAAPAGEAGEYRKAMDLIGDWRRARREAAGPGDGPAELFVDGRLDRLARALAEAGVGDAAAATAAAGEEAQVGQEVAALGREALWHVRQIAHDAVLRWPHLQPQDGTAAPGPAGPWICAALSVGRGVA